MTHFAAGKSPKISTQAILIAGCLIAILTFGPRSAIGQFQLPIITDRHWTTAEFSLAIAIQNLLWGIGQPFSGAFADRFGSMRVLMVGGLSTGVTITSKYLVELKLVLESVTFMDT